MAMESWGYGEVNKVNNSWNAYMYVRMYHTSHNLLGRIYRIDTNTHTHTNIRCIHTHSYTHTPVYTNREREREAHTDSK